MTIPRRLLTGLGAGVLLLAPLTACGQEAQQATDAAESAASDAATGSSSADTGSTGGGVDCSVSSCTVTFTGDGTEFDLLGTTVSLGAVENGRATIGVAGNEISCSEGETVSAGPLSIVCTTVSPDNVVLDASLG